VKLLGQGAASTIGDVEGKAGGERHCRALVARGRRWCTRVRERGRGRMCAIASGKEEGERGHGARWIREK
jgi:hypothetical protein